MHLNTAAFYGHPGFTYIDPNLIMILLVLFSLGTSRRLVKQKTEELKKRKDCARVDCVPCNIRGERSWRAPGTVNGSESERPFMCVNIWISVACEQRATFETDLSNCIFYSYSKVCTVTRSSSSSVH